MGWSDGAVGGRGDGSDRSVSGMVEVVVSVQVAVLWGEAGVYVVVGAGVQVGESMGW